jgi:hypothetical protein
MVTLTGGSKRDSCHGMSYTDEEVILKYKVHTERGTKHLEEKLNEIAAEGWELVSAVIDVPSYTLIFKRAA